MEDPCCMVTTCKKKVYPRQAILQSYDNARSVVNLASALADPGKSRAESAAFFSRHWGENYTPNQTVPPSDLLRAIAAPTLLTQLERNLKTYKKFAHTKRTLKKQRAQAAEDERADVDDLPKFLVSDAYDLSSCASFDALFIRPPEGGKDPLGGVKQSVRSSRSTNPFEEEEREEKKGKKKSTGKNPFEDESTPAPSTPSASSSSSSSRNPFLDSAPPPPPKNPFDGPEWRDRRELQTKLEAMHDAVDARLASRLRAKSDAFWRIVNSYGSLQTDIAEARERIGVIRGSLRIAAGSICERTERMRKLYERREEKRKMLAKLHDMSCLRDAQTAVQSLLAQGLYTQALDCIETGREVVDAELAGVVAFRWLAELQSVIGRMMKEELATLVQREFGSKSDEPGAIIHEGELLSVMLGLAQLRSFSFIAMLKNEIGETTKTIVRQTCKTVIVEKGDVGLLENMGEAVRSLAYGDWLELLAAVQTALHGFALRIETALFALRIETALFALRIETALFALRIETALFALRIETALFALRIETALFALRIETALFALRIETLQTAVVEVLDRVWKDGFPDADEESNRHSPTPASVDEDEDDSDLDEPSFSSPSSSGPGPSPRPSPSSAVLPVDIRTLAQLRKALCRLREYATECAHARVARLMNARDLGDESGRNAAGAPTVEKIQAMRRVVDEYLERGSLQGWSRGRLLETAVEKTTIEYVERFHRKRKQTVCDVLDRELWRPADVPPPIQEMVVLFDRGEEKEGTGGDASASSSLATSLEDADSLSLPGSTTQSLVGESTTLAIREERFVVVASALLTVSGLHDHLAHARILPSMAGRILMRTIELLKAFNSRTCQLILGAGALQLVGLKTISVKNLALASRSLQLVAHFIPVLEREFGRILGEAEAAPQLRYFQKVRTDYTDHVNEIVAKLISVIEHHTTNCLATWSVGGAPPSAAMQTLCKQLGKFHAGVNGIMPEEQIKGLFSCVHANVCRLLRDRFVALKISPQDVLAYGIVCEDFGFYTRAVNSMAGCGSLELGTMAEVLA
uniref:Vacuolar protein sorting-associated protein 54 n=1 Tax=Pristionchus pacificus TaxID=54126 RepID=A0A2A6C8D2_PRIPA|eukprot:PDM74367.1 vps-54 [Pristionchus pacificus]